MTRFSVGDRIIVRYGTHQGQKGRVIKTQQADVYEVKIADGFLIREFAKHRSDTAVGNNDVTFGDVVRSGRRGPIKSLARKRPIR